MNLLKEIDNIEEKEENKSLLERIGEECYYVSTNKYKQKKVDYRSKRELIEKLEKIFK